MSKIENPENRYLNLLQFILGILWLKSCYGKFISNDFIDNIAKTLIFFSSKNPVGWYKAFLVNTAIPYAHLFAELSRWGELTGGVLLVLTSVYSLYNYQKTKFFLLGGIGVFFFFYIKFKFFFFFFSFFFSFYSKKVIWVTFNTWRECLRRLLCRTTATTTGAGVRQRSCGTTCRE